MLTTTKIHRPVLITRMPRMLELEVFELRAERPDFAESIKYKNFCKEYLKWKSDELISRLRILCTNSRKNAFEILAVYDEFQNRC